MGGGDCGGAARVPVAAARPVLPVPDGGLALPEHGARVAVSEKGDAVEGRVRCGPRGVGGCSTAVAILEHVAGNEADLLVLAQGPGLRPGLAPVGLDDLNQTDLHIVAVEVRVVEEALVKPLGAEPLILRCFFCMHICTCFEISMLDSIEFLSVSGSKRTKSHLNRF